METRDFVRSDKQIVMDRVSAIIPVFNGERFVASAVSSVLGQSRRPDEIIVVDDGSTDRTAEIVKDFTDSVRLVMRPHLGGAAALNAGVEASCHPLLAFLDADDLWTSNKIELQLAAFQADASLDAVFGEVEEFEDREYNVRRPEDITGIRRHLAGISKTTMMIRRETIDRIGLFDPSGGIADFPEWYGRALQASWHTKLVNRVVAYRRIHDHNMSRLQRPALHREYLRIARVAAQGRSGR